MKIITCFYEACRYRFLANKAYNAEGKNFCSEACYHKWKKEMDLTRKVRASHIFDMEMIMAKHGLHD